MKSKVVLVAFLLMLYIAPMILGPSYTAPSIDDESNFTLSSGENWLSGWDYRRSHIVNGSEGAGTDYQVLIKTYYDEVFLPTLIYDTNWADNAHQGVTIDSTYVYTTNSTSISKYLKDGTFIDSHNCNGDGTYNIIGDLCHYDGFLYVVGHDGGHPAHGTAMKYSASDLSYVAEYAITDFASADSTSANIAYGNGAFWTQSDWRAPDTSFEIQRYDLSWSYQENWIVEAFSLSGSYRYQGLDWIDENYLITVPHEATTPETVDFYYFDGSEFSPATRLDRPEWTGEDSSTYEACQGVAVEIDGDTTYVWFASRNKTAVTQAGEVARYVFDTAISNEVSLNSNCQTDFDDVRFTDGDGVTELDYWLEDKMDSGNATFWVEVADDLGSDQTIYVYYGNNGVSSTSNGPQTFLLFDDFNDDSINGTLWDTGGATESGGKMSIATGDNKYIKSDNTFGPDVAIEVRMEQAGLQRKNFGFATNFPASSPQWICHDSGGNSFTYEGNDNAGTLTLESGSWTIQSLMWKEDYGSYDVDRAGAQTRSDGDIAAGALKVGANTWASSTDALDIDWLFLRKWIATEPTHGDWGEEEIYSPPEWTQISSIELLFQTPISEFAFWSFNVIMIFAGLIMMPVSALYLVRGGRKDLDSDKVFYAIVAFILGWALFLGGIMP